MSLQDATESGTYIVAVAFADEDDQSVVPSSITWTLTDKNGSVINSRQDVAIAVPAASVEITLSGDDLALQSSETNGFALRHVGFEAVYDSDAGADLPLKVETTFLVRRLVAV